MHQELFDFRDLAIFVGADLPKEITSLPSRSQLAVMLAERNGIEVSSSLADVAQRVARAGNRWEFTHFIRSALDITGQPLKQFYSRIVEVVQSLRIEIIISTAYDTMLETAFQQAGIGINRIVRSSDISFIIPERPTLIKLYGDIQQLDTLIVTDQDHLSLLRDRDKEPMVDEVRRTFRRNTVFFIGYNLADPEFRFIFDQVAESRFARTAYAVCPGLPEEDIRMWWDRGIKILDMDPLGILGNYALVSAADSKTDPEIQDSLSQITGFSPLGDIMNYKQGLQLLKDCVQKKSPDVLTEFATLEERFHKNERDERIFGSSENTRNTRSQIIYALNEMALTHCGISFNDLCQKEKTSQFQDNASLEQVIESLRRIESKIDHGQAQDRLIAIQILDAIEENKLDLKEANQIMIELRTWAESVIQAGLPLSPELRVQLDALAVHTSNANQYFQLAIPIIPGVLSYNVELGSQHQLDLKVVWNKIKARIKPESKGDGDKPGVEKFYGIGNRWAVVVGVNKYDDMDHYGELHVCVKDAQAVYNQFVSSGYKSERVRLLTDDTVTELPTRDNVLVALKSIALATEPDDILIFFYSGHGDEDAGESYLVARNGKRLALEDTAIKVSRIKQILESAPARAKVIILDACHSGANIEGKGPKYMTEEFIRRVFEQAEGIAILASCKQGQVSYEWRSNERSVFTYYLLEALQGQADLDDKKFVTVQDTNRHVSNGVKLWASQRNYIQTPTLQAETAGDIILVYLKQ